MKKEVVLVGRNVTLGGCLALIPLLAACAAETPIVTTTGGEPEASTSSLSAANQVAVDQSEQDESPAGQIDSSRRTAIVRAANRVAPAVVTVNVIRRERVRPRSLFESFFVPPGSSQRTPGLGSGFIISADGIVLTNEHVVRGAERIMVTLSDGRDVNAVLMGTDEVTDVAVLRIEGEDLPVAPLGTAEGLMIGEWAIAIGNPFGNLFSNTEPTVTAGVVSALGRHILTSDEDQGFYLGMVQTDASINPGNSGGPLVNAAGEVIGVNSSIFSRSGGSEGLGFAIPIDRAIRIADDLVAFGEVRRAWVGIDVEAMEADIWGRRRGVRISRIAPDSPAALAGLQVGDRLVAASGHRLSAPLDFEAVLLDRRSGDHIAIEIEGGEGEIDLQAAPLPSVLADRVTVLEDIDLITVTPQIQAERGLAMGEGALIVETTDALSQRLDLRAGDVILQINNRPVRSADDAAAALESVRGGGAVRLYLERNGGLTVRDFYWRG